MSVKWRYNKWRSILYFCISGRNINFWWGSSALALQESLKTPGETFGNTIGGPMAGSNIWGTSMGTSVTEIVQNHGKKNWTLSVLVASRLYNSKHFAEAFGL